jgi:hypothetical protein
MPISPTATHVVVVGQLTALTSVRTAVGAVGISS